MQYPSTNWVYRINVQFWVFNLQVWWEIIWFMITLTKFHSVIWDYFISDVEISIKIKMRESGGDL